MVAVTSAAPETATPQIPIETLRAVAIVLLVSYHVIGSNSASGLNLDYPEPLRFVADFLIDVRMPFFAFIAGFVYAIRPASRGHFRRFVWGKLRRLFVPFAVATFLFAGAASVMGNEFAYPVSELWRLPFVSYAHYWFLQSVLVIFVCFGIFDAVVRHQFSIAVLVGSGALSLSGLTFDTSVMSVNGALYLFPYFMLGVVVNRYAANIWMDATRLSLVMLCVVLACTAWNLKILQDTASFSLIRRDVQSLGFGLGICVLAFLWLPRIPILEKLAPYGFMIYLHHVFGTVAVREICDFFAISALEVRFMLGLGGGLYLPVLMHLAIMRLPLSKVLLGVSPERGVQPVLARA